LASKDCSKLRETLKRLFPTRTLNQLAADSGFVRRQRKIDPAAFFWTLVLGFGLGTDRTITALRCAYQRCTGVTLVPSSFYDRFTWDLVRFLKSALDRVLNDLRLQIGEMGEQFSAFQDVVLTDATVLKLHDSLEKTYPGCRTNSSPSAAKLHAVVSVKGKGGNTLSISSERTPDNKKFQIGPWVKGRLLLFDLGYYHFRSFQRISELGGYFLSRLKENANPLIVSVRDSHAGDRLVGMSLQDALRSIRREVLDAEIKVRVEKRAYKGRKARSTETFRLVAIKNHEEGKYHCYITNVAASVLKAEEIANTYRARWEIELLFKELKSGYRMDQIGTSRREIVEALIYSAVLTLVTSREMLRSLCGRLSEKLKERARVGRWWKLMERYAQEFLLFMLLPPRDHAFIYGLERMILKELIDPHTKRPTLLQQTLGETC